VVQESILDLDERLLNGDQLRESVEKLLPITMP
jgi:hypothetical protein